MKKIILAATLLSAISFCCSSPGAQDASSVDVNAIVATLKTIKQKQVEGVKSDKQKRIQQFQTAASSNGSALDFYLQAILATQFEGQSRPVTQFHEWKKKEADHLHAMQNAVRLHLAYLALTLQRSAGTELKDLLPQLINYTQQVAAERDALADQNEMMNRPLSGSIFVKWFQISNYVAEVNGWEMTPGNLNGIFGQTILPELRRQKDPRLLEYWDSRIQWEASQAAKTKRAFDMDRFNLTTRPQLLWNRAQELIVLGQKNRSINDMLALIKNYPAHPDSAAWISQLMQIVSPSAAPPPQPAPPATQN